MGFTINRRYAINGLGRREDVEVLDSARPTIIGTEVPTKLISILENLSILLDGNHMPCVPWRVESVDPIFT